MSKISRAPCAQRAVARSTCVFRQSCFYVSWVNTPICAQSLRHLHVPHSSSMDPLSKCRHMLEAFRLRELSSRSPKFYAHQPPLSMSRSWRHPARRAAEATMAPVTPRPARHRRPFACGRTTRALARCHALPHVNCNSEDCSSEPSPTYTVRYTLP